MKTALITGASRGIGARTAEALAQNGMRVILGCRSHPSDAEQLAARLREQGSDAYSLMFDVAEPDQVKQAFDWIGRTFGGLDVLVNNAGISERKLLTQTSLEQWNRILAVNLTAMFLCCKHALAHMIARQSGCIVNVSSIWGMTGASMEAAYSAAKAGVIGLSMALAKEVGPSGIRVNCVAPGIIDTDMMAGFPQQQKQQMAAETPLGRLGAPEDIAHTIAFLVSDQARYITGQLISPNGGFLTGSAF